MDQSKDVKEAESTGVNSGNQDPAGASATGGSRKPCPSLKFIPKYFILFDSIVNG